MTKQDDAITISFPARSGYLRLCRITTTTFAADLGFDVDELDDLRLAVDEAATWLLSDDEAGGDISISLRADGTTLIVDGRRNATGLPDRAAGDLVHAILGATLDDYALESSATQRSVELQKTKSAA